MSKVEIADLQEFVLGKNSDLSSSYNYFESLKVEGYQISHLRFVFDMTDGNLYKEIMLNQVNVIVYDN
jgi:hypothetical protein